MDRLDHGRGSRAAPFPAELVRKTRDELDAALAPDRRVVRQVVLHPTARPRGQEVVVDRDAALVPGVRELTGPPDVGGAGEAQGVHRRGRGGLPPDWAIRSRVSD